MYSSSLTKAEKTYFFILSLAIYKNWTGKLPLFSGVFLKQMINAENSFGSSSYQVNRAMPKTGQQTE